MKPHRLAEYFPLLEGDEFEQLKQDIAENGQLEPIVTYEGQILDGVNRYRACLEVGMLPDMKEFNGDDPLSYVISKNIRRRHLDTSQKSMIATEMLPELEDKARMRKGPHSGSVDPELPVDSQGFHRSRDEAAAVFGISGESVKRAKRIKEQAPEKVKDIIYGATTVGAVDAELRAARAAEKAAERRDKQEDKLRQEDDKEVAEYYDNLKMFKEYLKVHTQQVEKAIRVAEYGKFAPEAVNFTANKHSTIIDMMNNIQNLYDDLERTIEDG